MQHKYGDRGTHSILEMTDEELSGIIEVLVFTGSPVAHKFLQAIDDAGLDELSDNLLNTRKCVVNPDDIVGYCGKGLEVTTYKILEV